MVDLSAKHLSVQDEFDGMVPFPLIWEFVEGLFGKDIFELLVRLRHYIIKACCVSSFCSLCKPLGDCLSGLDIFQELTNEVYEELVTSVQIIQIWTCKAWWWWLSLMRF